MDGPVLHRLVDPAAPAGQVTVVLPPYQRPLLRQGVLRLTIQTATGRATLPLLVPGR